MVFARGKYKFGVWRFKGGYIISLHGFVNLLVGHSFGDDFIILFLFIFSLFYFLYLHSSICILGLLVLVFSFDGEIRISLLSSILISFLRQIYFSNLPLVYFLCFFHLIFGSPLLPAMFYHHPSLFILFLLMLLFFMKQLNS